MLKVSKILFKEALTSKCMIELKHYLLKFVQSSQYLWKRKYLVISLEMSAATKVHTQLKAWTLPMYTIHLHCIGKAHIIVVIQFKHEVNYL